MRGIREFIAEEDGIGVVELILILVVNGASNACISDVTTIINENGGIWMRGIREFIAEEDGIGVVELILILVVLIGLVLIFKNQLTDLVNNIFRTIAKDAGRV